MGKASKGKAVNIVIKIDEGERYRMGTLKIVQRGPGQSTCRCKPEALKKAFPLKKGDVFSTAKVRKAIEDYGKIYGEFGFIDFYEAGAADRCQRCHQNH